MSVGDGSIDSYKTTEVNDEKRESQAQGNEGSSDIDEIDIHKQEIHLPSNKEDGNIAYEGENSQYFDSNWANNLLMESNNEVLYNFAFGGNNAEIRIGNEQHRTEIENNNKQNENLKGHEISKPKQQMQTAKATKPRRPCDHCRRRKTKCVLVPNAKNCVQCESKSLTCTFVEQAAKRRPISELESEAKRQRDVSFPSPIPNYNGRNTIIPPNVRIREAQPVYDYSSIQNSLLKKTLSLQFPRSSFYVGPTSYMYDVNLFNYIMHAKNIKEQRGNTGPNKIEQINLNSTTSLRKVTDQTQFILKDDQSPASYQNMSNDVDAIEKFITPHGQILIDLYFRIIHPSYPILHKKVFLEKYSRTHREFSAPLLAAVYVLAVQWWDYDPHLNKFPKPNITSILKIGHTNFLTEISKRPKLSAVQAGLLLLQCRSLVKSEDSSNGERSNAADSVSDTKYGDWVLYSQVVALAEELGLGLDCSRWKLPKWERGLRKRLAWAVFVEDKWLALKRSRPSHIHDNNWVVTSLADEDFPEKHGDGDLKEGSSDIDNGKQIFVNLISLSTILSSILDQLYSMKAMGQITNVHQVLQIAKPLQLTLRNWYHSLPCELQMSSSQPRKLCSNGYIQLAYFATEITLHRKIVTVIYEQTLAGSEPPKDLVNICRSAARTRLLAAIDFVRELKPEHIHAFWYSFASSNFTLIGTFAAILYISSSTKEEFDFYRDSIFNYRWILKISSKGFEQAKIALEKLDLILNQIEGLLNDGSNIASVVPELPVNPQHTTHGMSPSNEVTKNNAIKFSNSAEFYSSYDSNKQPPEQKPGHVERHLDSSTYAYLNQPQMMLNYNNVDEWSNTEDVESKRNGSYPSQGISNVRFGESSDVNRGVQASSGATEANST